MPNFEAKEAFAVFCLNRTLMLEIIQGCANLEQAAQVISERLWEAKPIHWVYERAGLIKRRDPNMNVHRQEGVQEDTMYRLTESQAMAILTMPLRKLLGIEHDRTMRDWNECFFIEQHKRERHDGDNNG